jgi:CBS domain-containing protein
MYRFLEFTTQDYMTPAVQTVSPDTTMRELDKLLRTHDFNAFPVLDSGTFVGLVTKFDFLKNFAFTTERMLPPYEELMSRMVGEVMTTSVSHVATTTPLTRVLEGMVTHRVRSLPVLDDNGTLVGIISRQDVMRALDEATRG